MAQDIFADSYAILQFLICFGIRSLIFGVCMSKDFIFSGNLAAHLGSRFYGISGSCIRAYKFATIHIDCSCIVQVTNIEAPANGGFHV